MDRLSAQTSDLPRVKVLPVAVVSVAAVACLVTGCGGSKTSSSTERRSAPAAAGGAAQVVVSYGSDRVGLAGVPAAALPGITVLGTAEQTAKPDGALVRLTVGSGSDFGPGGPTFALVEQSEIDPVVHAVEKAGAEHVTVDRFGQSLYGPSQNAAQISLASHSPSEVETVIAAAQEAVRKHTDYNLQSANVVFTLSNCAAVEQKAWKAAIADARTRAERLAALSGAHLGEVLAVSEATATPCRSVRPRRAAGRCASSRRTSSPRRRSTTRRTR